MSVGKIIVIGIGVFIIAALLPDAIELLEVTNTTGWNAGTAALWGIITLVAIVTVVYYLLPSAWRGGK